MINYLNKRIKETNKSILFFKKKMNEDIKKYGAWGAKLHCLSHVHYHGLLGELAVLLEIKSKIKNESK